MKYVTYGRSVVESKIEEEKEKEKEQREREREKKKEREKTVWTTGISYRSRVGISESPYASSRCLPRGYEMNQTALTPFGIMNNATT